MAAVPAPRRPQYRPPFFHVIRFAFSVGLMVRLMMLPKAIGAGPPAKYFISGTMIRSAGNFASLVNSHPSGGLPHFCRHNSSGILTWAISGRDAMDSFVLGVPTFPRTTLRL